MDIKELKEILQILAEKDIAEFELEEEGMRLRIRKGSVAATATPVTHSVIAPVFPAVIPSTLPAPAGAASPAAAPPTAAAPHEVAKKEEESGLVIAKSPIVGTFYRAPDPNSPPFVSVGDRVRVGQVVCIVEAMKLMNEIEAEVAGEIVRIHQENGQPVQFGDPLFSIRPA